MKHDCRKIGLWASVSLLLISFLAGLTAIPSTASAQAPTFKAKLSGNNQDTYTLAPGDTLPITLQYQNTGTAKWSNGGSNFVSIVSVTTPKSGDPIKRISPFVDKTWVENFRPAKLQEASVPAGKIGTVKFILHAPTKEGDYTESFALVAKNLAWINGSVFILHLKVSKIPPSVASGPAGAGKALTDSDPNYDALKLIQSDNGFVMTAGDEKEFTVAFKNVGKKTWIQQGGQFVSLYTAPGDRSSAFYDPADPAWANDHQILMQSAEAKQGVLAYFHFKLKAPVMPGDYQETFHLVSEGSAVVKDSDLIIPITVNAKPGSQPAVGAPTVVYHDTNYKAFKLIQSQTEIEMTAGEVVSFRIGFKNTGTQPWTSSGGKYVSLYTAQPNYRASLFAPALTASSGWAASNQVKMETAQVNPGEIGFFNFDIKAPNRSGDYKETFRLAAENYSWIQGGDLELPITVTGNESPTDGQLPDVNAPKTVEPLLRVGLFSTQDEVKISANGPFEIRTSEGQLLQTISPGDSATVNFDFTGKAYRLLTSTINQTYSSYLRFVPTSDTTIMELVNYEQRPSWNLNINYNRYRGTLEARYSEVTGHFWIINELPMEQYLKGMAETSNGSPLEYLKTMTVAARTYAFYHFERQTKHADDFFTIDAHYDQVYKGYNAELASPDQAQGVEATRGEVVTYNGDIAITPYYSRSDGRTRGWSEVWGGDVPWCVSVPVPEDNGQTLLGHGVGMSARGAYVMAHDEGKSMEQILKYFYTGISIDKWY